jgi:hypothetical protein
LVIDNSDTELTDIPYGYKNSYLDVTEEYSMTEVGGYVTLKVKSVYTGSEADYLRYTISTSSKESIQKNYLNFYAKDYSEIKVSKEIQFSDNEIENIITASEEYELGNFWTLDDGNKSATIYAGILATYLKKPETRLRTMPLAITHPHNISQTIKIYLPEPWDIEGSFKNIESDGFIYHRSKRYSNDIITLKYSYQTKQDFIEADAVSDHVSKIDEVLDDNGLTIYRPLAASTGNNSKATYLVIGLIVIAGFFLARKKM